MENKFYHIDAENRKEIIATLQTCLERHSDIIFAYLHGSFVTDEKFKDIDIAVYFGHPPSSPLQFELELETELGNAVKQCPIDVRILNNAPLSFRYNVIKHGQPIVVNDDNIRSDFVESTLSHYFDFSPFRQRYLKEALGSES